MAGREGTRRHLLPSLLLAAVAAGVYLNTLPAQFTFDDSFAVVGAAVNHLVARLSQTAMACGACRVMRGVCPGGGCSGSALRCSIQMPAPRLPSAVSAAPPSSLWRLQIYNGDVTDPGKPLSAIFTNDFW